MDDEPMDDGGMDLCNTFAFNATTDAAAYRDYCVGAGLAFHGPPPQHAPNPAAHRVTRAAAHQNPQLLGQGGILQLAPKHELWTTEVSVFINTEEPDEKAHKTVSNAGHNDPRPLRRVENGGPRTEMRLAWCRVTLVLSSQQLATMREGGLFHNKDLWHASVPHRRGKTLLEGAGAPHVLRGVGAMWDNVTKSHHAFLRYSAPRPIRRPHVPRALKMLRAERQRWLQSPYAAAPPLSVLADAVGAARAFSFTGDEAVPAFEPATLGSCVYDELQRRIAESTKIPQQVNTSRAALWSIANPEGAPNGWQDDTQLGVSPLGLAKLCAYLRMNLRLLDERGNEIELRNERDEVVNTQKGGYTWCRSLTAIVAHGHLYVVSSQSVARHLRSVNPQPLKVAPAPAVVDDDGDTAMLAAWAEEQSGDADVSDVEPLRPPAPSTTMRAPSGAVTSTLLVRELDDLLKFRFHGDSKHANLLLSSSLHSRPVDLVVAALVDGGIMPKVAAADGRVTSVTWDLELSAAEYVARGGSAPVAADTAADAGAAAATTAGKRGRSEPSQETVRVTLRARLATAGVSEKLAAITSQEQANAFLKHKAALGVALRSGMTKSRYPPGLLVDLRFRPAPLHCRAPEAVGYEGPWFSADVAKCYTLAARSITHQGVFCEEDLARPYDGSDFRPNSIYVIVRRATNRKNGEPVPPLPMDCVLTQERMCINGIVLQYLGGTLGDTLAEEWDVESERRPSEIVEVGPAIRAAITDAFEDPRMRLPGDTPEEADKLVKFLCNAEYGMMNKVNISRSATSFTTDEEDANALYMASLRAGLAEGFSVSRQALALPTKGGLVGGFGITTTSTVEATEGWAPAGHDVYCIAAVWLDKLRRKMEAKGHAALGIHTDDWKFAGVHAEVPRVHGLAGFINGMTVRIKTPKHDAELPAVVFGQREPVKRSAKEQLKWTPLLPQPRPSPDVVALPSEATWDQSGSSYLADARAELARKQRVLIEARYAGSGKTYLSLDLLAHRWVAHRERALVVVHTNSRKVATQAELERLLVQAGSAAAADEDAPPDAPPPFVVATAHGLLGVKMGAGDADADALVERSGGQAMDVSGFATVFVDECYSISQRHASRIFKLMDAHESTRWIAAGDVLQLPDVDARGVSAFTDDEARIWRVDMWRRAFPSVLSLNVCKRGDAKARQRIMDLTDMAFPQGVDTAARTEAKCLAVARSMAKSLKPLSTLSGYDGTVLTLSRGSAAAANALLHAERTAHLQQPRRIGALKTDAAIDAHCAAGGRVLVGARSYHRGLGLECVHSYVRTTARFHSGRTYVVADIDSRGLWLRPTDVPAPAAGEPLRVRAAPIEWTTALFHFDYGHATNVHRAQGASIRGDIILVDTASQNVTLPWMLVACTRGLGGGTLLRYVGSEITEAKDAGVKFFSGLMRSNMAADKKAGRTLVEGESWFTADEGEKLYKACGTRCTECHGMMSLTHGDLHAASIDRLTGGAHASGKCRVVCLACNKAGGAAARKVAMEEDE